MQNQFANYVAIIPEAFVWFLSRECDSNQEVK